MREKSFSITNVILGLSIFFLLLLALLSWPDPSAKQREKKAILSVSLKTLVTGAHLYMDEHDVNVVSYNEAAQFVVPTLLEMGDRYADLSVFEINNIDTSIKIATRDGDTIIYEFEAFKRKKANMVVH